MSLFRIQSVFSIRRTNSTSQPNFGLLRSPWRRSANRCVSTSVATRSVKITAITDDEIKLQVKDTHLTFLQFWLRDHCRCNKCFHPLTKQRQVDTFQIPDNIRIKDAIVEGNNLVLHWPDNHTSTFDIDWLGEHRYGNPYTAFDISAIDKVYWNATISESLPEDISYEEAMKSDDALKSLFKRILKYGFAFVDGVPLENKEFEKLLEKIGNIKRTIFGDTFEFTSNQVDHKDTAYLSIALGGHTDGTYFFDSPGLQVFHCKLHDGEGGETLLVDGIQAALTLREQDQEAFEFLSTTRIPSAYYEDNVILRNYAPMIRIDPSSGDVYQVRINNDDRDVFNTLDSESMKKFYRYLKRYYTILRSPENSYWVKLTPGRPVIVDNWRVLHGRAAFTGKRCIFGAYILKDDFLGRARFLFEN